MAFGITATGIAKAGEPLTQFSLLQEDQTESTYDATYQETVEESTNPFSFSIEYSLYSDHIFRGINFSEWGNEGRERPNHQLDLSMDVDLGILFGAGEGVYGTLSLGSWFEWFSGQKSLDPIHGGHNLQEVDYTIGWSYEIKPIASTLNLGFVFYTFPNVSSGNTQEWSIGLDHNDAWMWKWLWPANEDGVLNPSFTYYQDVGEADGGSWMELQLSHEFAVCQDFTLTPEVVFGVDHRYLDPILSTGSDGSTRLSQIQYGLTATYDLTRVLQLPECMGSMSISGFLYFSDAIGPAERNYVVQDELYGGMALNWEF